MKVKTDPRHKARRKIAQHLFALEFNPKQRFSGKTREIWDERKSIDPMIAQTAPEWPLEKLNKTDLAILRLAVYELIIEKKQPVKVIIDEAVELAKELGSENSSSFVNGVLGTIVKEKGLEENDTKPA